MAIQMEKHEDGWWAHVTFYAAGEHHLHFSGTPQRHHLSREWGDHEVDVARHHQIVGPFWVELAINPSPILEHAQAHIELFVYDLAPGDTKGAVVVSGVFVAVVVHDPAGGETTLTVVEEETGEYEAEFEFEDAGEYELHVTMGHAGDEGEFHVHVLAPAMETPDDNDGSGGGHGHGN